MERLDQIGDYPDFSEFICKEARIVCNPMSSVLIEKYSERKPSGEIKRPKADTFAINIPTTNGCTGPEQPLNPNFRCTCCGESHSLHKYQRQAEKSGKEKRELMLVNKLCFACLRKGHYSKDCKKKATCSLCKGKHPTPLHKNRPFTTDSSVQGEMQSEGSTSCSMNGDGGESTSMIVPVWMSSPNISTSETLVYALLDIQSSHTFTDQKVFRELQAKTEPVKMSLSTLTGRNFAIQSNRVTGLRVRVFSSDVCIDLPPAYSREFIPLERPHIPHEQNTNYVETPCQNHIRDALPNELQ